MKRLSLILSLLFLLCLSSCGTVIQIEGIQISVPERDTRTPVPSPTLTLAPSATTRPPTETASPTASATVPVNPTFAPTQIGTFGGVTLANLNVRSGAGSSFAVLRVIPVNTRILLIARSADSLWLKLANENGWVSSQYVRLDSGNVSGLPEYDPTPTREGNPKRISYNINGNAVPNRGYLDEVMTSPCKTIALVMDNLNMAIQLKERCPETIVISRSWNILEGSEWFYRSPQSWVNQWKQEGHPEIVRHSTNEPSFGGAQAVSLFVNAEIELMRLAREAGFTVVVGNFSVGYVSPSFITSGLFDSYLRAINQYRHYLGLHEYSVALLPFGVGQWQAQWLTDRNRVQVNSWPRLEQLPMEMRNGDCPPYWHLRRGDCFLLRADILRIPRPRIILTEFGWDNLPDVKPQIESLRTLFGLPQYFNDMRGVNTYPKLWNFYYPNWSFAQAACEQLKWADSIYPADYLGFALFTWSLHPHWLQTDFSGAENPAHFQLHDCLREYAE